MSITPRDLVTGVVEIASLPEVFLKVSEMINSPYDSAADIGRVLGNDAALTARLLKIVPPEPTGRLEDARRAKEIFRPYHPDFSPERVEWIPFTEKTATAFLVDNFNSAG